MSPPLHFVVPGPLEQRTGGYRYDAHVARGLRDLGWEVQVHELEGDFPGPDPDAAASLEAALEEVDPGDTAVVDGLAGGAHPEALEGARDDLRLVALVHHPLADETGLDPERAERLRALEARALAACHGVVTTSPFTRDRLGGWGVPAHRIRAVVPGTEPAPRAAGPGPGRDPHLLCLGSLVPRKGQDILVGALEGLTDLPWRCSLVGSAERDPDFAEALRRKVSDAGLEDRIEITGEVDEAELERRFHGASLFVLPSRTEGYGMALTEALARGLPVVGTTGGAVPETVPAAAGMLVSPGDVDALCEALRTLLENPDRREGLSAGARAYAASLPTWPETTEAFARALGELVGHRRG